MESRSPSIEVAVAAEAICGESPVWCDRTRALWWIDVHGRALLRSDLGGATRRWNLPGRPGALALMQDGGILLAIETTLHRFDPAAGTAAPLAVLADEAPDHRFNDGRCDAQGRFWIGTLPNALDRPSGGLWRFGEGRFARAVPGLIVPNGLAFGPGGRLYHADSRARTVWRATLAEDGTLHDRRVFATFAEDEGRPDGAAVDAEGGYWIAHVTGGRITRFAPDGRRDRTIAMPVSRPTMCAFGGDDLATLLVTTGREHLTAAELAAQPLAGSVLALRPGVRGLPEPRFNG